MNGSRVVVILLSKIQLIVLQDKSSYGAQYYKEMNRDFDVKAAISAGELGKINSWLEDKIWKYGCMKDPVALFESVCGRFDPSCYADYLENKFTEIYGL